MEGLKGKIENYADFLIAPGKNVKWRKWNELFPAGEKFAVVASKIGGTVLEFFNNKTLFL